MKTLASFLVALVVGVAIVIAMQPSTYHVERTVHVKAPAHVVWAQLADFEAWPAWNPWQKSDPDQKTEVTGDAGEVGHRATWDGEVSGKGSMTLTEVDAPRHLGIALFFEEPMQSTADTAFDLAEQDDGVEVTWSMDGENDFMGKAFSLFMDMDEMIGRSYEQGLADLKAKSEDEAKGLSGAMHALGHQAGRVMDAAAAKAGELGEKAAEAAGKVVEAMAGEAAKAADALERQDAERE